MLRFALAAVALILSTFVSPAIAGELRREVLPSLALGRDLPFLVYVPDGYDSDTKNYTVLYLLHGAGDDENAWATRGLILEKADQLIEKGVIPPTLIVMPGCPNCWWIDGPNDKAETAFWEELIPCVDGPWGSRRLSLDDLGIACAHVSGLLARFHDRWPRWVPQTSAKQRRGLIWPQVLTACLACRRDR